MWVRQISKTLNLLYFAHNGVKLIIMTLITKKAYAQHITIKKGQPAGFQSASETPETPDLKSPSLPYTSNQLN